MGKRICFSSLTNVLTHGHYEWSSLMFPLHTDPAKTSRLPRRLGVIGRKNWARRREADKMLPTLCKERKSSKMMKKNPTLARSEQSQPASARALLCCALTASPLNLDEMSLLLLFPPFFFFIFLTRTMKQRKTNRHDILKWLEWKDPLTELMKQTMRFPHQKTRSSSFVDDEHWKVAAIQEK